jgi:hypothetical protein
MKSHKDEEVNKLQVENLIIKLQKELEFIKDARKKRDSAADI